MCGTPSGAERHHPLHVEERDHFQALIDLGLHDAFQVV